jgi:site-specific recombinase XerD
MTSKAKHRGLFLKRGVFQVYVTGKAGFKQRSTGTSDAALARKIKRMCEDLKDSQDWPVLDAVLAGKLTLPKLYADYSGNNVAAVRANLTSIDLTEHLAGWGEWVMSNNGTQQTVDTYRAQVDTLVKDHFQLSQLTAPAISHWLTTLPAITTGTRRKYLYALKSFIRYTTEIGVTDSDPSRLVRSPKKNASRLRWETQENDESIVKAAPADYKALFAFIKATGAEVSAALSTLRRDVDLDEGLAHIRGSKNERRNRHDALIEAWALPILREHCKAITPNAPLWPTVTRDTAHHHHQTTCLAVEIEDYTLRDSRHSWAVRCRKRGGSLEEIASQLGHKNIYMAATVYGVFKPTIEERKASNLRIAK